MSGLRGRLFGSLAASALLATVLTVVVATVVLHRQAEHRRQQSLARLADAAASLPGSGGRVVLTGTASGPRQLRGARRQSVLAQAGGRSGHLTLGARTLDYAARDTSSGRVVLLGPTGRAAHNGPPAGRTVFLAGLGGLLVALLLSVPLARRLTRPLGALAAGARGVAAGRPGVRVDVSGEDELGQLGAAFNTMATELESARDAERTFLLAVSHELKTPLSAVRGYAEAIEDGTVEPRHGAAVIGEESARMERLVADLLDLARLRSTGFAVRRARLDLARTAEDAVARHAVRARALGVELEDESAGSAPGVGDPERALQVVSNLVENALRVGGRVTVRARPGAIEVRDDGPGIRAQDLPRAFERFFLHDRYRGLRPVGTGLGLALVQELVTAMGGQVEVESAPGRTVFTVRLDGDGPAPAAPALAGTAT